MLSKVLIISEDPEHQDLLCSIASGCGAVPVVCGTLPDAQYRLLYQQFAAILYEVTDQKDLCAAIRRLAHFENETPIVVVSQIDSWDSYLAAIAAGAFDCIDFPPYRKELERILCLALSECRSLKMAIAQQS